jgi:inosine/xanthosine triphosphate pyrophosphatase family protein
MTRPTIRIHDLATNEVIDREMTAVEFKEYEADQKAIAAAKASAEAKATAKAAILDRIGLTADELKTILG